MTDILIVDDDADLTQMLQEVLEIEGYSVAHAPDGLAALAWLQQEHIPPRALLIDISMPRMDGPTLIAHIEALPAFATVPLLVMTAERRPADYLRGLTIAGILTKPFHLDTLLTHVSHVVMQTPLAA